MKKQQYDVLIRLRDSVENAVGKLDSFFETAEVVLEETKANAAQIAAGVLDKIDEVLERDPLEDIVNKPKSGLEDLFAQLFKGGKAKDWGANSPFDNPRANEGGTHKAPGDVTDVLNKNLAKLIGVADPSTLSREQKVDEIAAVFPEWNDPLFVIEQSDSRVDTTYMGVKFGQKLKDRKNNGRGGFGF